MYVDFLENEWCVLPGRLLYKCFKCKKIILLVLKFTFQIGSFKGWKNTLGNGPNLEEIRKSEDSICEVLQSSVVDL